MLELEKIDLSLLGTNNYLVVVAFDIKDDKRRYYLNKFLRAYGIRVQYSVYECIVNNYYYSELCKNIISFINDEDKIRIYKLTSTIEIKDLEKINTNLFKQTFIV